MAQSLWRKTKSGSKVGFDKLWGYADKLGAPVNRLSNKLGSEAFWPTTLDKESDKAARILRSFCKDGFYEEIQEETPEGPKKKQKVLKKIPSDVIKQAKGLAIFTTMRTGLWISGAGGSGVLVARLPDGSWSPPSGLMLHTAGVGFLVGVDIYDCVMVINTDQALQAFQKVRCTVGGEISAVAGPVGMGGVLDSEVHKRRAPMFTYLKSRGFYAGVQIDGTILIERSDENERFYGYRVPVQEILTGKVRHPPREIQTLMQTIKAAQGDQDVDESLLPTEAPPSDFEIITEPKVFGVPDKDDPDPYGVLALEKEGFQIREAGTHQRPSWEQFTFSPSPSSPVFGTFNKRESMDSKSMSRRSSWRTSTISNANTVNTANTDRAVSASMSDMATQTEFDTPATSPVSIGSTKRMPEIHEEPPKRAVPPPLPPRTNVAEPPPTPSSSQSKDSPYVADNENSDVEEGEEEEEEDDDVIIEEPVVVHEVHRGTSPPRARLVQVKQAQAPSLPVRNPIRDRKKGLHIGVDNGVQHSTTSPPPPPPRAEGHSRTSSVSTFREHEQSSGHRSGSEDSMSSVEPLSGLERHLQRSSIAEKLETEEKENAEQFHSIPTTPVEPTTNPIG